MITLTPSSRTPLVTQIVQQIHALSEQGTCLPGTRMPSIRNLARTCSVSPLTVSNAYNRLVADGILEARRASGFFMAPRPENRKDTAPSLPALSVDSSWMLQRTFETTTSVIQAGCGWLSDSHLFLDGVRHALTTLARRPETQTYGYGNPYGHAPLRESIRLLLAREGITCPTSSLILTHGASQALELSIRALTSPGDTVLVEDPGYCNLFPLLDALGLQAISIPRHHDGPCLETLEHAARTARPKLFVLNTRLQNPTGTSCSPSSTHHVLSLAERYDMMIVEDDIFGALADDDSPTLTRLDQFRRVILIGSFAKTISPGLRVGFLACPGPLTQRLLHLKMASSLTSSTLNEALVHTILTDGRYRLHLERLKTRLSEARKTAITDLKNSGLDLSHHPNGGMFLWAKFRNGQNPEQIAARAAEQNIMLAPGFLFSASRTPTPWMRFNASQMNDPRLFNFLKTC